MPAEPPAEDVIRIVLQSDAGSVRSALRQLLVAAPMQRLAEAERGTAEIVLAEVLNNIGEHAYARARGEIEVTIRPGPHGLACTVIDHGQSMPGSRPPAGDLPPVAAAVEDLPEGGFGWHLIRILARDLSYRRIADRNELRFLLVPEQSAR